MSADSIREQLAEAQAAVRSGRHDQARSRFEAILAIDAEEPNARNWLGADSLARNDATLAVVHFAIACKRQPRERSHWLNLAAAYRALADRDRERAALEQALAIDQTDLLALVRMAELHERLGEATRAAERWAAVMAIARSINDPSPEFAAILKHAKLYVAEQQDKLIDAVEHAVADDLARATTRERRRMKTAADAWLGRRPIYANQCEGLHYPFLPADEFFDPEYFPWFGELEAATATILAELEAILADPQVLTPYISLPPGLPANKWSPLDKSLDWGAFHLWKEGVRFDEACARAPRTVALVESLPICRLEGRSPNVFFSSLKAGRHIPPHTGVTNVRSVVHLPLIVPEKCEFRVGGETRTWVEGRAFAFDDTIEHEAWNRSARDRAVLIFDIWNPHLSDHEQAMVSRLYAAADLERR